MAKSYQISNNIIFSINDDGSITKFATISESGKIYRVGEKPDKSTMRKMWVYLDVVIMFLISCILLYMMDINANNISEQRRIAVRKYNEAQDKISTLQGEITKLEYGKRSAEEALSSLKEKVGNTYPLIVSDIYVGNKTQGGEMETPYGGTIYSRNSMFLSPKIKYYGISSGNKTIDVKLYKPDGTLARGTSSPSGNSFSDYVYVSSGPDNTYEFSGFGSSSKGHWESGNYRFEIWYGNTCLKSKTFTVY